MVVDPGLGHMSYPLIVLGSPSDLSEMPGRTVKSWCAVGLELYFMPYAPSSHASYAVACLRFLLE